MNKEIEIDDVRYYENQWFVATTMEGEIVTGESIVRPSGKMLIEYTPDSYKGEKQLKISRIFYKSTEAILSVLLASGFLKGIKRSKSVILAETLKDRLFEVLDAAVDGKAIDWGGQMTYAPDILMNVKGIKSVTMRLILASWANKKGQAQAAMLAIRTGLSARQYKVAIDAYGFGDFVHVLTNNPYSLTSLPYFSWKDVDPIAQLEWPGKKKVPFDSPTRAAAAVREVLRLAQKEDGHTMLLKKDAEEAAFVLCSLSDVFSRINLLHSKLVQIGEFVMTAKWKEIEAGTAESIRRLQVSEFKKAKALAAPIDWKVVSNIDLNDTQKEAILMALQNNVSIITGNPGCGKTTILTTLLNFFDSRKITYALCAPTGAAKSRMAQVTSREAHTLHRYFKLFLEDEAEMLDLEEDVLVIDESSMLSSDIFYQVLRLVPTGCKVILVGDGDQLPPVGPGEPLLQMIEAGVPSVKLTRVYRQAEDSGIVEAAHAVLAGVVPTGNKHDFIILRTTMDELHGRVRSATNWMLDQGVHFDDIQILTPINEGPSGRAGLNEFMQKTYNSDHLPLKKGFKFTVGDPVIHVKNNYDLGVMNGDMGVVSAIFDVDLDPKKPTGDEDEDSIFDVDTEKDPYCVRVEYPNIGTILYKKNQLPELQLAYAITIHKSQGNQFGGVIVVLPYTFSGMYMRQLPYTGITRAKRICVVISIKHAAENFLASNIRQRRNSSLSYFLNTGDSNVGERSETSAASGTVRF